MDLQPRGPFELILRKLRGPLEEIVRDSHRTHRVGARGSRPHLVELLEGRQDRAFRFLDHAELRRESGGGRSRWSRGSRLGGFRRGLFLRAVREESAGRGDHRAPELPSGELERGFPGRRRRPAGPASCRTAAAASTSRVTDYLEWRYHGDGTSRQRGYRSGDASGTRKTTRGKRRIYESESGS
jgi:hypothetical protein